jgi:hypothetical protein
MGRSRCFGRARRWSTALGAVEGGGVCEVPAEVRVLVEFVVLVTDFPGWAESGAEVLQDLAGGLVELAALRFAPWLWIQRAGPAHRCAVRGD